MGKDTKIQWCDHTFNPWIGCTKVSPGCVHCYAETLMDSRYHRINWGKGKPRQRTTPSYWKQPHSWNGQKTSRRLRIFCASLADVFDEEVPRAWRHDLFELINRTSQLDWLLLTKRPEKVADLLTAPLPGNVWLGTSVEDQRRADNRIPELLAIPARIHFLSVEPLLGPVSLPAVEGIDWVIVGGESGRSYRYCDPAWMRALRDQCRERGIAFFMKQMAARVKTDSDIPSDLFIRQFPHIK